MKHNQQDTRGRSFLFTAAMLAMALARVQAAPYPDMAVAGPTDQFPAEFKPFNPPVDPSIAVHAQAPQIAEWTRQNQPGDTMVLTGEYLSMHTGIAEGRDTRFVLYGHGVGAPVDGLIQRLDGRQCALTLPESLPPDGVYLLWPHNDNGFGEPVAINQTEAWWIGLDLVDVGSTFSIYGQNLVLGDGNAYAYIEGYGWISSVSANPYKADFTCPVLQNGAYRIWAHNGHGGAYGWSTPLHLSVRDPIVWDENHVLWKNVKSYGAIGDGVTDDTDSILTAVNDAKASKYSTVYFPAGTYLISKAIFPNASNLRYKGAGMNNTTIQAASSGFSDPSGLSSILVISNNSVVEDLTINKGDGPLMCVRTQGGGTTRYNIRLNRVRLSALSNGPLINTKDGSVLYFESANNFMAKDCVFICNWAIRGATARQIMFENCDFIGVGDCNGFMSFSGSEFSLVNCRAYPLDASDASNGLGWAKGRWIHGNGLVNRVYIGGNQSTNMVPRFAAPFYRGRPVGVEPYVFVDPAKTGPNDVATQTLKFNDLNRETIGNVQAAIGGEAVERPHWGLRILNWNYASGEVLLQGFSKHLATSANDTVIFFEIVDQNAGEQFMWEGMSVWYSGRPFEVTSPVNLVFDDLRDNLTGYTFTIVDGRGAGQTSKILAVDATSGSVTLNEPLRVLPDATSICKIGRFLNKVVVYDNDLGGNDRAGSAGWYTATAGFNCYGGASQLIIDGNRFSKMRGGVTLWAGADDAPKNIIQPNVFSLVKGNIIDSCQYGLTHIINDWNKGVISDNTFFGHISRENTIINSSVLAFGGGTSGGRQRKDMCVYDRNLAIDNARTHGDSDGNEHNQVWVGNTFIETGGSGIPYSNPDNHFMKDNIWVGFDSKYIGEVPGARLHLPIRFAMLKGTGQSVALPLWNNGTAPLDWEASANASWLELSSTGGIVADENTEGVLYCRVAEGASPVENSTTTVTISGGGETRQITIVFEGGTFLLRSAPAYSLSGFGARPLRARLFYGSRDGALLRTWDSLENKSLLKVDGLDESNWYKLVFEEFDGYRWVLAKDPIFIGPTTGDGN